MSYPDDQRGLLQNIRDLLVTGASTVLTAGAALIGKVGIDQTTPGTTDSVSVKSGGFTSSATITRPSSTPTYSANSVVGNSSSPDVTGAVQFANIGPAAGGEILITSARFEIDSAAIISGETSFNLYIYNVTPPSALSDAAAFDIPAGDRASLIGKISLGTPVDEGSTLIIETDIINKQVTVLSGGSLFGYLVTVGGFTAAASSVQKMTLKSVAV